MNKEEFIKKAKDLGYSEEEINEIVQQVETDRADGFNVEWESIILEEKTLD